jgi:hypothetical protein
MPTSATIPLISPLKWDHLRILNPPRSAALGNGAAAIAPMACALTERTQTPRQPCRRAGSLAEGVTILMVVAFALSANKTEHPGGKVLGQNLPRSVTIR